MLQHRLLTALLILSALVAFTHKPYADAAADGTSELTLKRLLTRPYLWGTAPSNTQWPRESSRKFAFAWNEEGERFRDLYLGDSVTGDYVRLTDMKHVMPTIKEGDKRTEEERREQHDKSSGVYTYIWRPDGRQFAFEYLGDIWLLEPESDAKPLRLFQTVESEGSMAYSPDNRYLSFKRGSNVWVYDLQEGTVAQRTSISGSDKYVIAYDWFPDSERMLIIQRDYSHEKQIIIPDYTPDVVTYKRRRRANAGEKGAQHRVGISAATGGPVQWYKEEKDLVHYDTELSPDGKWIACHRASLDFKTRKLFLLDAETLEGELIYSETTETWIDERDVEWAWNSNSLLFLSGMDSWTHLYRLPLDATGEPPINLTPGEYDVTDFTVTPDSSRIFFTAWRPTPVERSVYMLDLEEPGTQPVRLGDLDGDNRASHSPDGRYSMLRNSNCTRPPDSYLVDHRRPGTQRRITHSPLPEFDQLTLVEPTYMQIPNPDGTTLWARVFLPPDMAAGRRYPAVFGSLYANGAKNHWSRALDQWMARHGTIVANFDLRASRGYGEEFAKGYYHNMGIVDATECAVAAEYFKKLDYVDGDNIGLYGHSYGGFLTHMVLFQHPGVFKAGISVAPVNDWENYNYFYTGQRLDTPKDASETYKKTSPIHLAEGLQDHLLMLHGMQDDNVLFQDTVKLAQKLIELNKRFEMVIYPKDDHGISREDSRVHYMYTVEDYFNRMLRGCEE